MAGIFENITQTIGSTPLIRINNLSKKNATILAKLESRNPCGSVKDRIALSMIEAAEQQDLLGPDAVIIEPTSGNTGIALAFVCAVKGYKLILTMPESMSIERRKLLEIFGAQIVLTPAELGMKGAIERAEQILKENPHGFIPQQFKNPANPRIHRQTTAEEIWTDTAGRVDFFVAGVGTGGTVMGVGRYLRRGGRRVGVHPLEPANSPTLRTGCKVGKHRIQQAD